jgi:hypothetical protein
VKLEEPKVKSVVVKEVAIFARMRPPPKRPGAGAERLEEVPLFLSLPASKIVVVPLMVSSRCQSSLVSDSAASVIFESSTVRRDNEAEPALEDITSCPSPSGASDATVICTLDCVAELETTCAVTCVLTGPVIDAVAAARL